MAFPIVAAIIGALLSGGLAGASQIRQNRSAKGAKESAKRAADVQSRQAQESARVEAARALRQRQLLRGSILAAAGESGSPLSGNFDTLLSQGETDADLNVSILEQNLQSRLAFVRSERDAQVGRANAARTSPLISSLLGALQGFQTGASIGGLFDDIASQGTTATENTVAGSGIDLDSFDVIDEGILP